MISNDTAFFHDSTVMEFRGRGSDLRLLLEDVAIGERSGEVEIVVSGCSSAIDGYSSSEDEQSLMVTPNGDVLTLKLTDRSLYLLVEWRDFTEKTRVTKVYDLVADAVTAVERRTVDDADRAAS